MCINTSKTKEMVKCFCKDRAYVESLPYIDINGTGIERVTQAKVLSVTISSDLSWNADEIVTKTRKRVCMLYQLKHAGINEIDLVRIYASVIRSVVGYDCPIWHTNFLKYLSDNMEIRVEKIMIFKKNRIKKNLIGFYFYLFNFFEIWYVDIYIDV